MSDFTVVLPKTTEEWQRDMNIAYNQALEDFEKCAIQQSSYMETEEGWSGMTVDTKIIKSIKEQLLK